MGVPGSGGMAPWVGILLYSSIVVVVAVMIWWWMSAPSRRSEAAAQRTDRSAEVRLVEVRRTGEKVRIKARRRDRVIEMTVPAGSAVARDAEAAHTGDTIVIPAGLLDR